MKGFLAACSTKIYQYLLRHPKLDAFQCYLRNCRDKNYCRKVACRDELVMKCTEYGEKNKDKNIYLIHHGTENMGFFAQYRELLKYLCYAHRFGFEPVIEWSKRLPYAEAAPVNQSDNPFEYYFKQPTGISPEDALQSYNVFRAEEYQLTDFFSNDKMENGENGYYLSAKAIDYLAMINGKYIKLNHTIQQEMDEQIAGLLGRKKSIGVHFRGTDYKNNYTLHPAFVSNEDYLRKVVKVLQQGVCEQVFLATDDVNTVNLFQKELGEKVVFYQDVVRAEGNTSVAFSKMNRELHHYHLGLEVLRDMLTLAACDVLVAGLSQVSICAQITKKGRGQEYLQIVELNSGINHNLNYFKADKNKK